jgi:hypothetical protein
MEVGDQRYAQASVPPGMTRYLFYRRQGGSQGSYIFCKIVNFI